MSDLEHDLALAEARLINAACAYVDKVRPAIHLGERYLRWEDLRVAVDLYRAALRAQPPDEALVERGMVVVRRLLEEGM